MALQPKITFCSASDNKSFRLFDISGLYNSLNNTAGYGVVNPDVADIATAVIGIILPKTTETININAFSTFPTLDEEKPFVILNTDLSLGAEGTIPIGPINITYTLTGTFNSIPFTVSGNFTFLISGSTECCLDKKLRDLQIEDCDCGCEDCKDSKVTQLANLMILLDGAIANASCGKKNKAQKTIDYVDEQCTNNSPCKEC